MGSPVSPAVANIFMASLEERALKTFAHPPTTWHRFVDDVFSIMKKSFVQEFLTHLNNQHPSIQFTFEMEDNRKLPFLDTTVHHCEDGTLRIDTFRKPTHTGRYLQLDSSHPLSTKRSVVTSLLKRIDYITLGDEAKSREEHRLREELKANGYPEAFINRTKARLEKRPAPTTNNNTIISTASIPYIHGVSEAIGRVLTPLGIRTVSRTSSRKWS